MSRLALRDRFPRTRRLVRALAAVGLVAVAAAFLLPLLIRGRLLANLVRPRLPAMCGRLDVESITLGATSAFDYLFGRPLSLTLEHVHLDDADGEQVLGAAHLEAHVRLSRSPLQVKVEDLLLAEGSWAMKSKPGMSLTLLAAFRAPGKCRPPSKPTPPPVATPTKAEAPRASNHAAVSVELANVRLQGMDVVFSFREWELSLSQTNTRGSLSLTAGGTQKETLLFEAHDAEAGPSRLRVGREGLPWTSRVPFERVSIARVAVDSARPADLVLEVNEAHTESAVLAGRAVFTDVFVRGRPSQPGLELDATWTGFGAAARKLDAVWRPLFLMAMGTEDVRLHATSRGPFRALAATLEAATDTLTMTVSLDAERNLRARWSLRDFDTSTRLPRPLHPLLGGRANGQFTLEAKLAPHLVEMSARLSDVALTLARARPGPFPPTFSLQIPSVVPPPAKPELLAIAVAEASLAQGALTLEGLRTVWQGARATASAKLRLPRRNEPLSRIDARLSLVGLDVRRVWPASPVTGKLALDAEVGGPAEDLTLALGFPGARKLYFRGRSLTLPRRTQASVRHGDQLSLPRLVLEGDEGARLVLSGDAVADGAVHARLALAHIPLTWLSLATSRPGAPLPVTGAIGGEISLEGPTRSPLWSGRVEGEGLRLLGVPSRASVTFRRAGVRTLFEAKLKKGEGAADGAQDDLTLTGSARLAGAPLIDAHATFTRFSLGPWLGASPLGKTNLWLTGTADASFDRTGLAWKLELPAVRARVGALELASAKPWSAQGKGDALEVETANLEGEGLSVELGGRFQHGVVDAKLVGSLAVRPWWTSLVARTPLRLREGTLAFDAQAKGSVARPSLEATVVPATPIAAELVLPKKPPLPLRWSAGTFATSLSPQARSFRVEKLAGEGLVLEVPGGRARLAFALAPRDVSAKANAGATTLPGLPAPLRDLAGNGEVDAHLEAAAWLPWFPATTLTSLAGEVDARAKIAVQGQQASLDLRVSTAHLAVRTPLLPEPLAVRHFSLVSDGQDWQTSPFDLELGTGGRIRLTLAGDSNAAAPRLSLTARGSGVKPPLPLGRISFESSDFELRMEGPGGSARYRLSGDMLFRHARITPSAPPAPRKLLSKGSGGSSWLRLIDVDLRVKSPEVTAVAPGPDLSLAADCHVTGPLFAPKMSGEIQGRGPYSHALFVLFDWFKGSHLRRCAP